MTMPNWLRRLWYGRYHGTLTRMITNEESVQIVFSEKDGASFDARLGGMLAVIRGHMIQHNNQVVLAMKGQIDGLMKQIEEKGKELEEVQKKIDKGKRKLEQSGLSVVGS
jgi:hypothetical protein